MCSLFREQEADVESARPMQREEQARSEAYMKMEFFHSQWIALKVMAAEE
jgi:hypothetical protein